MALASYKGKPLSTGSDKTNDDPKNAKTEIYDYQSDSWSDAPDYPYSTWITYYATTSTADSAYIIGGFKSLTTYYVERRAKLFLLRRPKR